MGLVQEDCSRSPRLQEETQENVYAISFAKAEQPMPLGTGTLGVQNLRTLTGSQPRTKLLLPSYFPQPKDSFLLPPSS